MWARAPPVMESLALVGVAPPLDGVLDRPHSWDWWAALVAAQLGLVGRVDGGGFVRRRRVHAGQHLVGGENGTNGAALVSPSAAMMENAF